MSINTTLHGGYVSTRLLNLDIEQIRNSAYCMRANIAKKFNVDLDISPNSAMLSSLYHKYNLFMYPYPGFHELYEQVRDTFHELNDEKDLKYYAQCWINFYEKDQFIDWHIHRNTPAKAWHGFYCVDCEPSHTSYQLSNGMQFDVESKNNLLVISKSGEDKHRTWPWQGDTPRITIAFDIVPQFKLDPNTCPVDYINHWVPI